MKSKNIFHCLLITFFLFNIPYPNVASAQQGSLYFSAGYNTSWYGTSTIHIDQAELGNSYEMQKVKGDNTSHSPISALKLNYHLGYFCDDEQKIGLELSFDPVNYQVSDNQNILIKGTVNNMFNVTRTVLLSGKNGSYYYYDGSNLFLLSFVRRFGIYRSNTNNIGVDMLAKAGFGPALPCFYSSLPVNPVNDPGLQWGGWNAGAEGSVRITLYRYGYLEFSGKYDYAAFDNLRIYEGTASQRFGTYEVMASLGVTIPTRRFNPLFRHERKIITILPFFMHKDEVGEEIKAKKVKKEMEDGDSLGTKPLQDIPEFGDIVNKNRKGDDTLSLDSLARRDSLAIVADEAARKHKKKRYRKEQDQHVTLDSLGNIISQDSLWNASNPDSTQHLSKKQLKKKKKELEKARKEQELKAQQLKDQPPVNGEEPKAPEVVDPKKDQEQKPQEAKPEEQKPQEVKPEEKKEPEVKAEEKKEPEMSKKERKRKAKEEKKAQKEKEKQDKKDKAEQERKDKEEQDKKDKEAADNKDKPGGQ